MVYDYILSNASLALVGVEKQILDEKKAIHFKNMFRKAIGKMRRENY